LCRSRRCSIRPSLFSWETLHEFAFQLLHFLVTWLPLRRDHFVGVEFVLAALAHADDVCAELTVLAFAVGPLDADGLLMLVWLAD